MVVRVLNRIVQLLIFLTFLLFCLNMFVWLNKRPSTIQFVKIKIVQTIQKIYLYFSIRVYFSVIRKCEQFCRLILIYSLNNSNLIFLGSSLVYELCFCLNFNPLSFKLRP